MAVVFRGPAASGGDRALAAAAAVRRVVVRRHRAMRDRSDDVSSGLYAAWVGSAVMFGGTVLLASLVGFSAGVLVVVLATAILPGAVAVQWLRWAARTREVRGRCARVRAALPAFLRDTKRRLDGDVSVDVDLEGLADFLDRAWYGPAPKECSAYHGFARERRSCIEGTIAGRPAMVVVVDGDVALTLRDAMIPTTPRLFVLVATAHADRIDARAIGALGYRAITSAGGLCATHDLEHGLPRFEALAAAIEAALAELPPFAPRERSAFDVPAPVTARDAFDVFLRALAEGDFATALAVSDPELSGDAALELDPDDLRAFTDARGLAGAERAYVAPPVTAGFVTRQRVRLTGPGGARELEIAASGEDDAYRIVYVGDDVAALGARPANDALVVGAHAAALTAPPVDAG